MIENEQEFREWCRLTLNDNTINSYVTWLNTVSKIISKPISPTTLASEQHIADAVASLLNSDKFTQKAVQNIQAAMRKYVAMIRSIDDAAVTHPKLLQKVEYNDLNARQKEIYNFQKVAALLADYGFNCIKLADDWQGADFLAYHFSGDKTLKIQLKARLSINKNYENKDLYVVFPNADDWYLIEHDRLIEFIGENTNWLNTRSWNDEHRGSYHSANPNSQLLQALSRFKL
jgi:hypothetical protein